MDFVGSTLTKMVRILALMLTRTPECVATWLGRSSLANDLA